MDPFQDPLELEQYKRKLGFDNALANYSGKIWIFWREDWEGTLLMDSIQHISMKFCKNNRSFIISSVYARCNALERLELWEELEGIAEDWQLPWMVGGDFNVIINEEEKLGGLEFTQQEATDFALCISSCGLTEVKFSGSKYTWWNGRIEEACIFKRLDRILVNALFTEEFPSSEVHHLIRQGSDHAPLHVICDTAEEPVQISTVEDVIKVKETQLEIFPTVQNRAELSRMEAELRKYLRIEEEYWKQKAGMKWFVDGDRNTKFFHSYVKGRRKKLHLAEICNEHGVMVKTNQQIGQAAISFFSEQFKAEETSQDYSMLRHIPKLVTEEENEEMIKLPTQEEIKKGGSCWEIVGADITRLVIAFFCGHTLPNFITHTNLVLLPKKEDVNNFAHMRPISLSSFINKIISRLVHDRIVDVLPKIISPTQSGFVKGRSITENVLLAQEIIRDIQMRNQHINVVVKLDMAKAYDRVSWIFLTKVLHKFGFSKVIIDMIWRLISSNWYSFLINGQSNGFFQSSRGLKQGDPLSSTLFIIAAEALARGLDSLHSDKNYKGYGLPKWSPAINHLSYADDTILFCSGARSSVIKMMTVIRDYEEISGQMVNKAKSAFYLHDKTPLIVPIRMRKLTGIRQGNFPFTYLGCPVFYGRKINSHFEDLVRKVARRILSWQNKFLSFRGKYILISHILQSIPVYLSSAMNPPKKIIAQLHQIFAKFFWGNTSNINGKHWVDWSDMCYPKAEGGLGFRSLHDVNNAMFAKLWWRFRVSISSLWSNYMRNKYCKKLHPTVVRNSAASHVWRKLLVVREEVEHEIWWQVKAGSSSFWYDNWTKQGALFFTEGESAGEEELEVKEFIGNGSWKIEKLQEHISEEMICHIVKNIQPNTYALNDKPWWMGNSIGVFSAKSAYHLLRNKRDIIDWMSCIWIKGLPLKFSFFLWRVWKKRIATDDNLRRMRMHIVSKCYCCDKGELETMTHLLLTAPIAQRLWKQFASCASLNIDGIHLHHLLIKWWKYEGNPKLQQIMKAIPTIVTWELWKMRNSIRHDKKVSFDKMFSQCQMTVHRLIKANYPWLKNIPLQWSGMFDLLQRYRPTLFYHIVRWTRPKEG
ncbi:uncharacterized protein [Solanum tuberosum]|uniref:uncharacterized protein n=1 Tax=Solanum tuberosum TaxID=4113 RepID=UPI00073A1E0F|nr:PREDICTED: uncharacterized protein LOC107057783 [Solanum tuberosum]